MGMAGLAQQVESFADIGHGVGSALGVEISGVERFEEEIFDLDRGVSGPDRLVSDHFVATAEDVGQTTLVGGFGVAVVDNPAVTDDCAGVAGRTRPTAWSKPRPRATS